jgi:hypothetical protein
MIGHRAKRTKVGMATRANAGRATISAQSAMPELPDATINAQLAAQELPGTTIDAQPTTLEAAGATINEQPPTPEVSSVVQADVQESPFLAKARDCAIAYMFVHIFNSPAKEFWAGKDGTNASIREKLGLPASAQPVVKRVMESVLKGAEKGTSPVASAKKPRRGRKPLIESGSFDEQLMADCIEGGLSYARTTIILNRHRVSEGRIHVGQSAVRNAVMRLNPVITYH